MGMHSTIKGIIDSDSFYRGLFGDSLRIIESKRAMLKAVWSLFKARFSASIAGDQVYLIAVPNRVEMLGKHTDYQGGETLLLTGPKNFFAIAAPSRDGISHLVNAERSLGETVLKLTRGNPEMISTGLGSNYTYRVISRLTNNLIESGLSALSNVKAVFLGDIPIGGGTSGSSAKVITDFLIFTTSSSIISQKSFLELVKSNGMKAGLQLGQEGLDDHLLALSMYIAHYENGLDFGDLKGDRGVGTFGGSEDHTAIILGKKNRLLFCRYCPTELIDTVRIPDGYDTIVAYSGKRAEKTKDAMKKYNRLSDDAAAAVKALNDINGTSYSLLRDFYPDLSLEECADAAREQLTTIKKYKTLAGRAYQFFRERDIIFKAVRCLRDEKITIYGQLMNESHDLSKKYLHNIAEEVDYLQKSANQLGAIGATGFGGGFGGCCYALIKSDKSGDFTRRWMERYFRKFPHHQDKARFDVYPACQGAHWKSHDFN